VSHLSVFLSPGASSGPFDGLLHACRVSCRQAIMVGTQAVTKSLRCHALSLDVAEFHHEDLRQGHMHLSQSRRFAAAVYLQFA